MLFNQPFTGAAEFKALTVHEEMKRAGSGSAERWQFQLLASAAQCRMIRHGECESQQWSQ
jgi:hypothetical protein